MIRERFQLGTSTPPRVQRELPLSKFQLKFPRRLLKRQLTLSTVLVAIPVLAFRLDIDVGLKWFAVVFALLALFFLGALSEGDQETLDAERYYGRGTLIGIGIVWLVLIVTCTVGLYLEFPRP